MKLVLEEQNLTLCGRFTQAGTKDEFMALLREGGAKVTKSLGARTTAVVIGLGWNSTQERAAQRGLPVITEAQALELLEHGELELEEEVDPEVPLDAVFGEARALLDGEPDAVTWSSLIELLDRCAPEHADALAEYLSGPLDRWVQAPTARYLDRSLERTHPLQWLRRTPFGELRVAPPGWMREATTGEFLAKHQLARAVVLTALRHSNRELIELFGSGSLRQITHLDLGAAGTSKLSQGALKALAKGPMAPHVKHLRLSSFRDVHVGALSVDSPLSIDELRLNFYTTEYSVGALRELMDSSWMANLGRVIVESYAADHLPGAINTIAPWTRDLERFGVDLLGGFLNSNKVMAMVPGCPTLELRGTIVRVREVSVNRLLACRVPSGTRHLDLSRITPDPLYWYPGELRASIKKTLFDRLPNSPLTSRLSTITLGAWRHDALVEQLDACGVEVVG